MTSDPHRYGSGTSAACFAQGHKIVNSGGLSEYDNVGGLVQDLGGQGKNAAARTVFCS